MDRKEALEVFDEITARLACPEDEEYDYSLDLAERVFANFMNERFMEGFRQSLRPSFNYRNMSTNYDHIAPENVNTLDPFSTENLRLSISSSCSSNL
jgi:hypothetical protein